MSTRHMSYTFIISLSHYVCNSAFFCGRHVLALSSPLGSPALGIEKYYVVPINIIDKFCFVAYNFFATTVYTAFLRIITFFQPTCYRLCSFIVTKRLFFLRQWPMLENYSCCSVS